ncbi:hypothetical protein FRB95_014335 [Tulasnella sp. JGI-2019a]|nr:hypothetical protein FRB95_014335 [Tulasnella sp. JGI-2019a]
MSERKALERNIARASCNSIAGDVEANKEGSDKFKDDTRFSSNSKVKWGRSMITKFKKLAKRNLKDDLGELEGDVPH